MAGSTRIVVWRCLSLRRDGGDLPSLWASPRTTPQERQEIVRLLLEQVTVTVQGDSELVDVILHWAGGRRGAHRLIRPVQRYDQLSTYPKLLARIETLRGEGLSFEQIAEHLNREGFYPPKRTDRFNGEMLARLLSRRGLHGRRPQAMVDGSLLKGHEYWLTDLARELSMPIATLHKWQRMGWVHRRKVPVASGRLIIWADEGELERLRQLRAYKRQWPEPRYPAILTTPRPRG